MPNRIARVLLVAISIVILVLSLNITAAAADNGQGGRQGPGRTGVSGQHNGWQGGVTADNGPRSGNYSAAGAGFLKQYRWQQNAAKGNGPHSGNCTCTASAAGITSLGEDEIKWLTYMREEEKLARDVYTVLYEKWAVPVFNRIALSEQKHLDAIEKLLAKYAIADPVADESVPGNFTISELNTLYSSLQTRGLSSLREAYLVGVDIEESDIADLKAAIGLSGEHPDIVRVYQNLLDGSENHLAAFTLLLD
jgi:hypothetical protein